MAKSGAGLDSIRKRLQAERSRIAQEVRQVDDRSVGNQLEETGELTAYDNHQADIATSTFARERDLTLEGNLMDLLEKIDAALERVDAGTYGDCAECGQPISKGRLEALPWAIYCVDCQARVEVT